MKKTNTDYVIEELKRITFPLPRKRMTSSQLKEIENQIEEIEESILVFKEHMKRFKT
ncbi:hypothetical protein [Psychroserpens algicola]|uniref:hypothetical protein n=1 Tax=Psychroserpens algicola TaxID=1719034 RepID=UPI00195300F1|nr:hypothetical protein [Psychroserpens algicola]